MSVNKKKATGILDKNTREVMEGDWISLNCQCCFYEVIWDKEKKCWWPNADELSQIHLEHVNVWECEFEICEEELGGSVSVPT